jgi:hypothetical protein
MKFYLEYLKREKHFEDTGIFVGGGGGDSVKIEKYWPKNIKQCSNKYEGNMVFFKLHGKTVNIKTV